VERGTKEVLRDCVISGRFFTGHSAMNLSDTFRSHAQECQRMASSMRDAADKATWSQMAKRWLAYAEYYEDRRSAFGTRAETRRQTTYSRWAQTSTSN